MRVRQINLRSSQWVSKSFAHNAVKAMARLSLFLVFVSWNAVISAAETPAQLTEEEIKAAFLLNFARFVTWPAETFPTPTSPIVLCIAGDSNVRSVLAEAASGKSIDGRPALVKNIRVPEDVAGCHVLFIDSLRARQQKKILDGLKSANVLTVGESNTFLQSGGMINFVITGNQVKLEINLESAERARLKLSAKLINVARLVSAGGASAN